jgi:AcrR family transcriptional regulator
MTSAERALQGSVKSAPGAPGQAALILEQAARAFAERGYATASMSELAAACGVSKALLYHYYDGKDAILFDLLDRYMKRLLAIVDAVQALRLEPRAHLRALIREFLAEYENSRLRHVALVNDTRLLASSQRARIVAQQRKVVTAFSQAVGRACPAIAPARRKPAAMLLFGMINWTFTWLEPEGKLSYAEYADMVIAVIEHGLKGAAD